MRIHKILQPILRSLTIILTFIASVCSIILFLVRKVIVRSLLKVTLVWLTYNYLVAPIFINILNNIKWIDALYLVVFHHILKIEYVNRNDLKTSANEILTVIKQLTKPIRLLYAKNLKVTRKRAR